jgi:argininosuccinate lyase
MLPRRGGHCVGKLWSKNYELDSLIEAFTVGGDYLLDARLVTADCAASIAHAEMLCAIGILDARERDALRAELRAIAADAAGGRFVITPSDEDCHTAIENRLTAKLGEAGKKIHTGRSRNDQVLAALRVYTRSALLDLCDALVGLVDEILAFADRHAFVPMPGRTHTQIAMPSSVGLWAAAFAEELIDDLGNLRGAAALIDQSPLGSAASYGVPLPLDRERVAELLAFSKVQNNVLYVNNSRGKFESIVADALDQIGLSCSKIAADLILFSLPELGYFHLPAELCSGSSIMPQKRNPDGLELVRARSATLSACAFRMKSIIRSLPSGYNRDFQETKGPLFDALDVTMGCIGVMHLTFTRLEVDAQRLRGAMVPEIYATDAALDLVAGGESFREAYRSVGTHLDALTGKDPEQALRARTSSGTTGNLRLDVAQRAAAQLRSAVAADRSRVDRALGSLLGAEISIV